MQRSISFSMPSRRAAALVVRLPVHIRAWLRRAANVLGKQHESVFAPSCRRLWRGAAGGAHPHGAALRRQIDLQAAAQAAGGRGGSAARGAGKRPSALLGLIGWMAVSRCGRGARTMAPGCATQSSCLRVGTPHLGTAGPSLRLLSATASIPTPEPDRSMLCIHRSLLPTNPHWPSPAFPTHTITIATPHHTACTRAHLPPTSTTHTHTHHTPTPPPCQPHNTCPTPARPDPGHAVLPPQRGSAAPDV